MITELKRLNVVVPKETQLTLHPKILDILLEYRQYIKSVFLNINGLYDIAHIGITIISPANQIVVFSSTPNIEYNLINQKLWQEDQCFLPQPNNNRLSWWNTANEEIDRIKLKNNKFTLGMSLTRKVNDFYLLYSFATSSKRKGLTGYYESNIFNLIDVGDYFYKSILDVYPSYSVKFTPPKLVNISSKAPTVNAQPYLKLVVNNQEEERII